MSAAPNLPSLPVDRLLKGSRTIASGVPEGFDAVLLGELARQAGAPVLHVARDANRLATLADAISFFAPDLQVLSFPAWDSVPYDRVAPNAEIIATRIETLAALTERAPDHKSSLVLVTTVNAVLQRVPPPAFIAGANLNLASGSVMSMQDLIGRLETSGYGRAGTVTDPGQYAVRGGILDLYPPGGQPVRLDFFGDTLESLRAFDPDTQRTEARLDSIHFLPMSEVSLTPDVRTNFRQRYVELFGTVKGDDPLYEAISAGQQHQGMEHWLPLFHDKLATLFDYLPDAVVTLDPLVDDARESRIEQSPTTMMPAQTRLNAKPSARRHIILSQLTACFSPRQTGRARLAGARWSRSTLSSGRRRGLRMSFRSAGAKGVRFQPNGRPRTPMSSMRLSLMQRV